MQKGLAVKALAEKYIVEKHVHKCSENCGFPCMLLNSPASKLWICFTCHRSIMSAKMPAEAAANNLYLEPIPEELKCLNSLE